MSTLDLCVLAGLGLLAAWPWLQSLPKGLLAIVPVSGKQANEEAWRQKWVATLIDLQTDLEERSQTEQVDLCRNLIWQLLGGESE